MVNGLFYLLMEFVDGVNLRTSAPPPSVQDPVAKPLPPPLSVPGHAPFPTPSTLPAAGRWSKSAIWSAALSFPTWLVQALILVLGSYFGARRAQPSTVQVQDGSAVIRPAPIAEAAEATTISQSELIAPAGHVVLLAARAWSNGVALPPRDLDAFVLTPKSQSHQGSVTWRVVEPHLPENSGVQWELLIDGAENASPEPVRLNVTPDSDATARLRSKTGRDTGIGINIHAARYTLPPGAQMPDGTVGTGTRWMGREAP